MVFGWAGQILKLDLSNMVASTVPTQSYTKHFIGGRGISVKMLYDEVKPKVSMFDPENKICFAPGVLTGTPATGSSRAKITALSAGGLLRNSGIGGHVPEAIKLAGYDLIMAEGKAEKPVYAFVNGDSVEFKNASHLWGKDVYEAQQLIKDELGKGIEILCIGPGGENEVAFGSVHTDWSSVAGRCGFGGIMGSKNLKAIAVRGSGSIKIAKLEEFLKVAQEQREQFASREEDIEDMRHGGDRWLAHNGQNGGTFARGNWEDYKGPLDWDNMKIGTMDELAQQYGAGPLVCGSCPISHFILYDIPQVGKGAAKCTGTTNVTGTLWVNDWKDAFHFYNLMNRYGLDCMSTSNIIAFLMELYDKGIITEKDTDGIAMERGNNEAILAAIHKIGRQEGFGKLFKNGVVQGAKQIGRGAEDYAMAVKELELEPWEYRAIKALALGVVTNSKDNIDALPENLYRWLEAPDEKTKIHWQKEAEKLYGEKEAAIPSSYEGPPSAIVYEEGAVAASDMVGMCKWLIPFYMTEHYDVQAKLFSLATGVELDEEGLLFAAQRVITLERAFNVIRGVKRKSDTLPKRMFKEPVPTGPFKGDRLDKAKFDKMLSKYYALRDYDSDGVPTEASFTKYGLTSEWKSFKKLVPSSEKEATKGKIK
ncbi:aldehyde ferredoxin oxidoreductase family protein [Chloroflexota bacterium]